VDNVEDRNQLVSMLRKANLYSKFHMIFQTFRGRYIPTPLPDPSNVKEDIASGLIRSKAEDERDVLDVISQSREGRPVAFT
jgi:hypothetical protein